MAEDLQNRKMIADLNSRCKSASFISERKESDIAVFPDRRLLFLSLTKKVISVLKEEDI